MAIDIACLREDQGGNPEFWRENQRKRQKDPELVDRILELDNEWRTLTTNSRDMAKDIRQRSTQVGKMIKKGEEGVDELKEQIKGLQQDLERTQTRLQEVSEERNTLLGRMGNILHESVPIGKDEEDNGLVSTRGGEPRPQVPTDHEVLHHHELLHMIDGYEPEKGVATAGHRAYYLKGPGLVLNLALIQYGIEFLRKRGSIPVQPPFFMNKEPMSAVAQLDDFDEQLYKVIGEHDDEKYLIATSEQPLCALHRNEWIAEKDLPIRYAGWSSCFRKEAGSHGKDTWGIFRVHQFDKIEQFVLTEPEKSWEMQEEMLHCAEEFYDSLGLAYRVVNIVSGELNNAAARKLDLEAWFPGFQEYRELVSCSNCTDYQARGMGTRCGQKKKGDRSKKYVHMLNSTLCATTRTICAILENYQTPDGIRVPEVLVPYTGGLTFIPFVKDKPVNVQEVKMQRAAAKKKGEAKSSAAKKPATATAAPPAAAGAGTGTGKAGKATPAPRATPAQPPVVVKSATAAPAGTPVSLTSVEGLNDLNRRLGGQSFVDGVAESKEDVAVFLLLHAALLHHGRAIPDELAHPHIARWFRTVRAMSDAAKGRLLQGGAESKFYSL